MATTTNFGWETPDDTDLVKDGAAAIRTALGGVDTSFVDLKGGTTGQVLAKASNTDLDYTWVAQDDSNAIQNALLTTTGDTIYASSASTPARLGIGTSGQVLTVAAGGVPSWATPSGPSYTWTSWTPTYTNLTVGNGTVTAKYIQIGKLVTAYWKIVFGSTTSVGGSVDLTLPINAVAEYAYTPVGYAKSNADEYFMGGTALNNKWKIQNMIASGSFVYPSGISSTSPNNWTTGNYITLWASYEVA